MREATLTPHAESTWSSLPSDLALMTDGRRAPPITGAGTARKLDVVRGVVALDSDDARFTEFRRRPDAGSGGGATDDGGSAVLPQSTAAPRSTVDGPTLSLIHI